MKLLLAGSASLIAGFLFFVPPASAQLLNAENPSFANEDIVPMVFEQGSVNTITVRGSLFSSADTGQCNHNAEGQAAVLSNRGVPRYLEYLSYNIPGKDGRDLIGPGGPEFLRIEEGRAVNCMSELGENPENPEGISNYKPAEYLFTFQIDVTGWGPGMYQTNFSGQEGAGNCNNVPTPCTGNEFSGLYFGNFWIEAPQATINVNSNMFT
ncbi:MAG TPA: hypothetical protein VD770_00565, partial [Coxiellaceae bacterium]|nr:hypothetical protein [Coxiellaceae bacterium]